MYLVARTDKIDYRSAAVRYVASERSAEMVVISCELLGAPSKSLGFKKYQFLNRSHDIGMQLFSVRLVIRGQGGSGRDGGSSTASDDLTSCGSVC